MLVANNMKQFGLYGVLNSGRPKLLEVVWSHRQMDGFTTNQLSLAQTVEDVAKLSNYSKHTRIALEQLVLTQEMWNIEIILSGT